MFDRFKQNHQPGKRVRGFWPVLAVEQRQGLLRIIDSLDPINSCSTIIPDYIINEPFTTTETRPRQSNQGDPEERYLEGGYIRSETIVTVLFAFLLSRDPRRESGSRAASSHPVHEPASTQAVQMNSVVSEELSSTQQEGLQGPLAAFHLDWEKSRTRGQDERMIRCATLVLPEKEKRNSSPVALATTKVGISRRGDSLRSR